MDTVLVTGDNLGGLTPGNDATVLVTAVNGTGGITAATITGTALSGSTTPNVANTYNHGSEIGSTNFDIAFENNAYTVVNTPSSTTQLVLQ